MKVSASRRAFGTTPSSTLIRAAISGIAALCLLLLPALVNRLEQPCPSFGGFPGRNVIEDGVGKAFGGCLYLAPENGGVVVRVAYLESDSEFRRERDVVDIDAALYRKIDLLMWTRLPFRIIEIEIRPRNMWGSDPAPIVMARPALEALFGPRPPGLKFESRVPLTDSAKLARFARPVAWTLVVYVGVRLALVAWRRRNPRP